MRMDKSYFKKQSFEEAADHQKYYQQLSEKEKAAVFLKMMQAAYGYVGEELPKMEKVFTGKRKMWCE
jgi:hypothetical protein